MRTRNRSLMVLAVLIVSGLGNSLWAASPVPTTITIADMHCMGCAKKVAAQVNQVPGVATVQADVKTKRITVTPKGQSILSPRALWEAVENAGKQPDRLEGPSGTFTAKPQS